MSQINTEQGQVYQRLASGLRINKSSDDAAGLAIADSLNADARIFTQGVRNLNDGISLLSIADSAIENLTTIVTRLMELAEQGANGPLGTRQRASLDLEAQSLSAEYLRIIQSTDFNSISLLNGNLGTLQLQAGQGSNAILNVGVGGLTGTGSFDTTAVSPNAGYISMDIGDINNDGILDIASATSGGPSFSLGNGDGTFQTAVTLTGAGAGLVSREIELSDLNNDGNLDFIASGSNLGAGTSLVWLGDGRGNFSLTSTLAGSSSSNQDVTTRDLNGDGFLDMITAGETGVTGQAQVRLGNGNGTFGSATSYSTLASSSYGLSVADVNNDGKLDMLTAGIGGGTGQMSVRLGNGDGTFSSTNTVYNMDSTESEEIQLKDLNGDGKLDAVTIGGNSTGTATVRLGNGDGTFQSSTSFSMGNLAAGGDLELGDLNGDGFLDLMVAGDNGGAGTVMTRLGTGTGSFGAMSTNGNTGLTRQSMVIGDFNQDGVIDFAAAGNASNTFIGLGVTRSGVAPLLAFSLRTISDSKEALSMLKTKQSALAKQRGEIGANQARVVTATNILAITKENFVAAESRIRDADIAEESSKLIRNNILQQVAGSVVNKANLQPEIALKLLI